MFARESKARAPSPMNIFGHGLAAMEIKRRGNCGQVDTELFAALQ
jgi:hypothetical protein